VERFVHCSTVGIYGDVGRQPATETTPANPGDIYQETKLAGEKLVWDLFGREGFPVVIARPTGVYGPGDYRYLKLFRAIQQGWFVMLGDGRTL
jgi:nucleoside-diphosphate-sugar epimerase